MVTMTTSWPGKLHCPLVLLCIRLLHSLSLVANYKLLAVTLVQRDLEIVYQFIRTEQSTVYWGKVQYHRCYIILHYKNHTHGVALLWFDNGIFIFQSFFTGIGAIICLTSLGSHFFVHLGVRDKSWVSEIHLSQPRHETAFWWRHNGPMTSQLTVPIKWPNYPLKLIWIYVHLNTHNKESLTQRCGRSTNVQLCLKFWYISIRFES